MQCATPPGSLVSLAPARHRHRYLDARSRGSLGSAKTRETKKEPRFKPAWEVGETVRVVIGPFADFNGVIEDINMDQSKVRVLVDIFGRETPVELNFDQIVKY